MFKYKNKGYTLAELLVSIAIFSIVMIGITSIMSNSLKSYTVSNKDAELQEQAQIVGNQLEEYLCEATNLSSSVAGSETTYVFDSKKKSGLKLVYNDSTNKLSLNGVELASEVDDFAIDGFASGGDNNCVVRFKIGDDYQYDFSRSIALKNDPENKAKNNISNAISNLGYTPDPSSDDIKLNIKRFDEINLTSAYGVASVDSCDSKFITYTLPDTDLGKGCVILKPGNSINQAFASSFDGTLVGKDSSGSTLTIKLKVDPVEIVDGVVQFSYSQPTNSGLHNVVSVKGINLYNALKGSEGYKCEEVCTLSIYNNSSKVSTSDKSYTFSTYTNDFGVDDIPSAYGDLTVQFIPFDKGEMGLFCLADPYTGSLVVSGGNDSVSAKCSGLLNEKNYYIHTKLEIKMVKADDNSVVGTQSYDSKQLVDVLGSGF